MPLRSDMLPGGPADLIRMYKELQREFREFRAARRLEAATIGSGGLTITSGGYIKVIAADGTTRLWLGGAGGAPQGLLIRDSHGNVLISEDTVTGGFGRPYSDIPMYPARSGDMLQTTSAAYEVLWRGIVDTRNPRLAVSGWALAAAATTGNVRVKANGTVIGSAVAVTTTLTQWTVGPLLHNVAIGTDMTVEVEAQMTGGTGPVRIGVHHARGEQA